MAAIERLEKREKEKQNHDVQKKISFKHQLSEFTENGSDFPLTRKAKFTERG